MINSKIEEIWPIVDEIVVKSILEYKERFFTSYHFDDIAIMNYELK